MAREVTIPILPCRDIDEVIAFYEVLGFTRTYRQRRPNPYAVLKRDGIELHFAGLDGFDPEQSYGSCIVAVTDADALYRAFADELRTVRGRVPASGIPRMTRPRKRMDAVHGFSVVDPGGNWIRVTQVQGDDEPTDGDAASGLARATAQAATLGDSKGDSAMAVRVLDMALARHRDAPAADRVRALVYRAELAVAMGTPEDAMPSLASLRNEPLDDADRATLRAELARAAELEDEIGGARA